MGSPRWGQVDELFLGPQHNRGRGSKFWPTGQRSCWSVERRLGIEGVQGNFTICPKSIVTEDSRETLWVIEGKQEKKNQQLINRSTTLVPGKHPPLHPLGGRAAGQQRNLFQRLLPDDRQGLLSMDALAKTPPLKGH